MLLVMRVLSIVPLNFTVSLRWTRTLWLNSQLNNERGSNWSINDLSYFYIWGRGLLNG